MRFVKTAESILNIPSGFTRVAYLESTGTQYIDTGIKGKNNIDFDYRCIFTNLDGTAQCVGGNWSGSGSSTVSLYLGLIRTNGNFAYHYDGTQSPAVVMNTTVQDTPYSIKGHMWTGEQYMIINGTKSSVGTISSTFTSTLNMYLFGLNNNGLANPTYMKLYYCKIWDDGVLVRDFIPCIDPLGRACMYDLVGKKAYYNQGTGEFTVGRQIIPVEYLESTGTQYIDTGIYPAQLTKAQIDMQFTSITKCSVLGSNNGASGDAGWNNLFGSNITGQGTTTFWCQWGLNFGGTFTKDLNRHTHIFERNGNTSWAYTVDTTSFTNTSGISTQPTNNQRVMYLFACNNNGTLYREASVKVYFCKIWDGGTIVRDFIPCKDENNVGFMFDNVSGTVYENAGTGAFVVGQNKYKMKLRLIKDNILPTGYTQVEYLEASGAQYIDTGIKSSANMSIKIKFNLVNVSSAAVFGSYSGSPSNGVGVFFGTAGGNISGKVYCNNTNIAVSPDLTLSTNTDYEIEMSDTTVVVNDSTYTSAITASNNYNMALFARSNNGTIERQISGKVYYYRAYDNDTLVRNFIPAIDPSGTPCMYDLVSKTPFYNAGTGTFTTGKPVLPIVRFPVDPIPGYKIVNYLGSDSTAYIDTGVSGANDNLKIEMDFSYSKFYAYGYFFSNYESEQHDTTRFLLDASNNSRGLAYINTRPQNGAIYTPYSLTMNDRHNIIITKTSCSLDGVITTLQSPPVGTENTKNIILFNRGAGSYANTRDIGMKCWYFKIYDNNTIIRNFIPVVRLLDNKAGMWDTVTKQFYTTPVGDFITG